MSKANRRRPVPGSQRPTVRPTGDATPNPSGEGTPRSTGASPTESAGPANLAGSGTPAGTPRSPGAPGTTSRPATAARHGRRERSRAMYQPSFMERNRTPIIAVAAAAGVALLAVFVFLSASQPAFACSQVWQPSPTAPPAPGATPNLGYVQPDLGNAHVNPGTNVTYTYCAPASGSHYFRQGVGPIAARVYGPGDNVIPQGWIHNLEHGGLVILYQGTSAGATPEGQAQMKAFYQAFPPAESCGPVIARFDQMSAPFQAMVWGRVLPLDTFDEAQIKGFWNQWGGRSNPEKSCPAPNSGAAPSSSVVPSSSVAPGSSAGPSVTALPSTAPSGNTAPSPS